MVLEVCSRQTQGKPLVVRVDTLRGAWVGGSGMLESRSLAQRPGGWGEAIPLRLPVLMVRRPWQSGSLEHDFFGSSWLRLERDPAFYGWHGGLPLALAVPHSKPAFAGTSICSHILQNGRLVVRKAFFLAGICARAYKHFTKV